MKRRDILYDQWRLLKFVLLKMGRLQSTLDQSVMLWFSSKSDCDIDMCIIDMCIDISSFYIDQILYHVLKFCIFVTSIMSDGECAVIQLTFLFILLLRMFHVNFVTGHIFSGGL